MTPPIAGDRCTLRVRGTAWPRALARRLREREAAR